MTPRRSLLALAASTSLLATALAATGCGQGPQPASGAKSLSIGTSATFASRDQASTLNFAFGPSDGTLGVQATGGTGYAFFASGASSTSCPGGSQQGTFRLTGSISAMSAANGCDPLFTAGPLAGGWLFGRDYAGGGPVVPFTLGATRGLLMTYHGEVQWQDPSASDGLCDGVACFYASLGLAISTDDGASFTPVGQVVQPYQPLQAYENGSVNVPIGYGTMVIADAWGAFVKSPAADPSNTYVYIFFDDIDPQGAGDCQNHPCLAVARARLADVLAAALPPSGSAAAIAGGSAAAVAGVFHKYDAGASDPWSSPATGGDPGEAKASGHFSPVYTGALLDPSVVWDAYLGKYLMVALVDSELAFFESSNLVSWERVGVEGSIHGALPALEYPSLTGETGDPLEAGPSPRLYVESFDAMHEWAQSAMVSASLSVTGLR